jgi:hypothetical protein
VIKREAKFSIQFRHWLRANPQKTCAIEMKDTRGKKSFYLKEWKDAQRTFAEAIRSSSKGVLVRTEGVEGLPDYIYLRQEPSLVVIKYPLGFAIIDSAILEKEETTSLSPERAQEIGTWIK